MKRCLLLVAVAMSFTFACGGPRESADRAGEGHVGKAVKGQELDELAKDMTDNSHKLPSKDTPATDESGSQGTDRDASQAAEAERVAKLIKQLWYSTDRTAQENAEKALLQMGRAAVDHLIKEVTTEKGYADFRAIHILGEIGDHRAVGPLVQVLRDHGDAKIVATTVLQNGLEVTALIPIGEETAKALGKLNDPRAIEPLSAALLESRSRETRWAAGKALIKMMEEPAAVRGLAAALTRGDVQPVPDVLQAVRKDIVGNANALEVLVTALKDQSYDVRQEAAELLGETNDPRAVEPLIRALSGESPLVQHSAEASLAAIAGKGSSWSKQEWHKWWAENKEGFGKEK